MEDDGLDPDTEFTLFNKRGAKVYKAWASCLRNSCESGQAHFHTDSVTVPCSSYEWPFRCNRGLVLETLFQS